ncbi:MAG TPA: hypothetical protein VJP87_13600 [Candidatus Acidoferrales bacterium]|nr:hypothetical protein [Candidatus Acidoferrales bacterium]
MILIVSSAQDTHARHIAQLLEQRGCETKLLSRADFGAACRFTLDPVGRCGAIRLEDGTAVASDRVSAVWYRRPGAVPVDVSVTEELDRSFAEKEWAQSLDSFFTIAFRRIVSPPLAQRAALKPIQLRAATEAGLRVPKTIVTSDPEEALDFASQYDGAIVHKAITSPVHRFVDTRAWNPEDLKRIGDLPLCPTLFQERIEGPGDIRITVVSTQIFAAYLSCRAEVVDSRLDAESKCSPHELPAELESAILRLMDKLGLVFGTIDLKVTKDGEYVFLEVNPQGQFLYIEMRTGLAISQALADFLAA